MELLVFLHAYIYLFITIIISTSTSSSSSKGTLYYKVDMKCLIRLLCLFYF